jgi:hypothetical protein
MALLFVALLIVGFLTCIYLAWKLLPRLFRWMVADNDIHKSLRRTLAVVGCAAIVSLLVFLVRSQNNESPQTDNVSAEAPPHPVNGEIPVDPEVTDPTPTPTQERGAEKPTQSPNTASVIARGTGVVPGAIVCPDLRTVNMMFQEYSDYWEDAQQDAMTHGQSKLLRGEPAPKPDFELFDCALLASGSPMSMELGNVVPVVTATLPDGSTIKGVTLPSMVQTQ